MAYDMSAKTDAPSVKQTLAGCAERLVELRDRLVKSRSQLVDAANRIDGGQPDSAETKQVRPVPSSIPEALAECIQECHALLNGIDIHITRIQERL